MPRSYSTGIVDSKYRGQRYNYLADALSQLGIKLPDINSTGTFTGMDPNSQKNDYMSNEINGLRSMAAKNAFSKKMALDPNNKYWDYLQQLIPNNGTREDQIQAELMNQNKFLSSLTGDKRIDDFSQYKWSDPEIAKIYKEVYDKDAWELANKSGYNSQQKFLKDNNGEVNVDWLKKNTYDPSNPQKYLDEMKKVQDAVSSYFDANPFQKSQKDIDAAIAARGGLPKLNNSKFSPGASEIAMPKGKSNKTYNAVKTWNEYIKSTNEDTQSQNNADMYYYDPTLENKGSTKFNNYDEKGIKELEGRTSLYTDNGGIRNLAHDFDSSVAANNGKYSDYALVMNEMGMQPKLSEEEFWNKRYQSRGPAFSGLSLDEFKRTALDPTFTSDPALMAKIQAGSNADFQKEKAWQDQNDRRRAEQWFKYGKEDQQLKSGMTADQLNLSYPQIREMQGWINKYGDEFGYNKANSSIMKMDPNYTTDPDYWLKNPSGVGPASGHQTSQMPAWTPSQGNDLTAKAGQSVPSQVGQPQQSTAYKPPSDPLNPQGNRFGPQLQGQYSQGQKPQGLYTQPSTGGQSFGPQLQGQFSQVMKPPTQQSGFMDPARERFGPALNGQYSQTQNTFKPQPQTQPQPFQNNYLNTMNNMATGNYGNTGQAMGQPMAQPQQAQQGTFSQFHNVMQKPGSLARSF